MTVRPATAEDVSAVRALDQEAFGEDAWSEDSVREELTGPGRVALVACDPDVVGYLVTRAAGDAVDLQRVAVRASHRRRGLARNLLAGALDDGDRVLLEVGAENRAARSFYAAEGFAEIARRRAYYRDGTDAVVMERPRRT